MYVKLENNIPVKWPVSEYELRRQFPKKSYSDYSKKAPWSAAATSTTSDFILPNTKINEAKMTMRMIIAEIINIPNFLLFITFTFLNTIVK